MKYWICYQLLLGTSEKTGAEDGEVNLVDHTECILMVNSTTVDNEFRGYEY